MVLLGDEILLKNNFVERVILFDASSSERQDEGNDIYGEIISITLQAKGSGRKESPACSLQSGRPAPQRSRRETAS